MISEHDIHFNEVEKEIEQLSGITLMYYNLIMDILRLYKEVKSPENKMTCDVLLIRYRNQITNDISEKLRKYLSYCNPNLVTPI